MAKREPRRPQRRWNSSEPALSTRIPREWQTLSFEDPFFDSGISAGPLRDASAPPYRGRSILEPRRPSGFTAHVLSVAGSVQSIGTRPGSAKTARPMSGHKISTEVLDYVRAQGIGTRASRPCSVVQSIQKRFGITIHRRTLERARRGAKKSTGSKLSLFIPDGAAHSYETLRPICSSHAPLHPARSHPSASSGNDGLGSPRRRHPLPTPPPRLPTVPSQVPFPIAREVIPRSWPA